MATTWGMTAVLMWGLLALLGSLTTSVPPFQLLFLCFSVSAAIMLLRRATLGQPLLSLPRLSSIQWSIGIMGLFGFHFCYFMALKTAPAIEVSLIVYLWPLLLSVMVAKRGCRLNALLGGILGFVGIVFIMAEKAQMSITGVAVLGYLFSLLCAVIWSTYSWYLSSAEGDIDDIGWLSLAVAVLSLAVLSLAAHLLLETGHWHLASSEWIGIVLLGLGPVGGAFYLWDNGLKYGNRQLLASMSFGAPLISALVLAMAGLNRWSEEIVLALVLITVGALIANRKTSTGQGRKQISM